SVAAAAVAVVMLHAAALTNRVEAGQLARGTDAISAGGDHTCALKDGGAFCWGANDSGQVGDGTTTRRLAPVAVSGMASGVTAISAGWGLGSGLCAVKDGGAWCWGYNGAAQTAPAALAGLESGVSTITSGLHEMCALKDGDAWCW